jgi:hypothetical protein
MFIKAGKLLYVSFHEVTLYMPQKNIIDLLYIVSYMNYVLDIVLLYVWIHLIDFDTALDFLIECAIFLHINVCFINYILMYFIVPCVIILDMYCFIVHTKYILRWYFIAYNHRHCHIVYTTNLRNYFLIACGKIYCIWAIFLDFALWQVIKIIVCNVWFWICFQFIWAIISNMINIIYGEQNIIVHLFF